MGGRGGGLDTGPMLHPCWPAHCQQAGLFGGTAAIPGDSDDSHDNTTHGRRGSCCVTGADEGRDNKRDGSDSSDKTCSGTCSDIPGIMTAMQHPLVPVACRRHKHQGGVIVGGVYTVGPITLRD